MSSSQAGDASSNKSAADASAAAAASGGQPMMHGSSPFPSVVQQQQQQQQHWQPPTHAMNPRQGTGSSPISHFSAPASPAPFSAPSGSGTANNNGAPNGSESGNGRALADDRSLKRVKMEHESFPDSDSPASSSSAGWMGSQNVSNGMLMPGSVPGAPGTDSMHPYGMGMWPPPQPFPLPPGHFNGYPNGNDGNTFPFQAQQAQQQGYVGGIGPPGQMGPPMFVPGSGFPGADQQPAGSGIFPSPGPSTPAQTQGNEAPQSGVSTPAGSAPKEKKPRAKKQGGGKRKAKDGEGNEAPQDNAGGEGAPPADTTPGKGKKADKAEKGDKAAKPKRPRKKKDDTAPGSSAPSTAPTPAALTPAPGGASLPGAGPSTHSTPLPSTADAVAQAAEASSSALQTPGPASRSSVPPVQQSGSALPPVGPAVEASGDNVDQLQDLLGMSGVDLRAEEEAIHSGRTAPPQPSASTAAAAAALQGVEEREGRSSPFYLELYALSHRIHRVAARDGLRVEPEVLMYLSNAAKLRFRNLLEAMVTASRHRAWSSHLRPPPLHERARHPMYHEELHDDPQKLLSALTRVEKAEEQADRQRRLLRDEREADAAAGIGGNAGAGDEDVASGVNSGTQTPGDGTAGGDASSGSKPKKTGASAAARNMTEDKRLKLANKTAAQALGITSGSKAWMFGGGSGSGSGTSSPFGGRGTGGGLSRLPKPRFAAQAADEGADVGGGGIGTGRGTSGVKDESAGTSTSSNAAIGSNPGGWGDLTARRRHREEEERRRARLVNLDDALHALEMERSGGAGRGSGERTLYATRALGRPHVPPRAL